MKTAANLSVSYSSKLLERLVVLGCVCLLSAHASASMQQSTVSRPSPHASHRQGTNLEDRVNMLTQVLGLDAKQQSELRKVLEGQREQVRKVWDDESVPAAYRVIATQSISDKTADRIRALLNEEQRKIYMPPRPAHAVAPDSGQLTVEAWMKAANRK